MNKVEKAFLICSKYDDFNKEVNELIKRGYQPSGTLRTEYVGGRLYFSLLMVKYKGDAVEDPPSK